MRKSKKVNNKLTKKAKQAQTTPEKSKDFS
jgi:hypothetical protein